MTIEDSADDHAGTWTVCFVGITINEQSSGAIHEITDQLFGSSSLPIGIEAQWCDDHFELGLWHVSSQAVLDAAISVFRALQDLRRKGALQLRFGIATGEVSQSRGGSLLERLARDLMRVAMEGQFLVSKVTVDVLATSLVLFVGFDYVGRVRLTDRFDVVEAFQLVGPHLPTSFPHRDFEDGVINTLPKNLPFFVGREWEREELADAINHARLISVTGAKGVGKSHLICRVVAELLKTSLEGVIHVDCRGLGSDRQLLAMVANAFLIKDLEERYVLDAVLALLKSRSLLVFFDNCETCGANVAPVVERMIQVTSAKVVTSGPHSLHLKGEKVIRIAGLSVPDPEEAPAAHLLEECDATSLFVDQLGLLRPTYSPIGDAAAIVELCRRLEGNPGRIILAARALGNCQVSQGLELLIAEDWSRVLPNIHVKGLIEDPLLATSICDLVWAVSRMKSPWSLNDAAAFLDVELRTCSPVLDAALSRGLVVCTNSLLRYRLSEFALDTVGPAEPSRLEFYAERYHQHLIGLLCTSAVAFQSAGQSEAFDDLEHYRLDVESVFHDLLSERSDESFTQAMIASWEYWYSCNRQREALRLLEEAFARAYPAPTYNWSRLKNIYGILAGKLGLVTDARQAFNEAIAAATTFAKMRLVGAATSNLANLEWSENQSEEAVRRFEEGQRYYLLADDQLGLAKNFVSSVSAYIEMGHIDQARIALANAESTLFHSRDHLDQWSLNIARGVIGHSERNFDVARNALVQAVTHARALRDAASVSRALLWLASVETRAERHALAAELLGAMIHVGSNSRTTLYRANEIHAATLEGILRTSLGPTEFGTRRLFGQFLSLDLLLERICAGDVATQ